MEEIVVSNDYEGLLATAIASLTKTHRIVLTLRYIEDLSYQQIADILELPLGTVKSNIHRGRNALRAVLQKNHLLED